ncbi:MAG: tRNA lysidine(34) synthetase TilS [Leptonema sp. (in: bacteria)]
MLHQKLKRIQLDEFITSMQKNLEMLSLKNIFIPDRNLHYIISISGGPDSVFLAYLYNEFKKKEWIKDISLFHFNHQIRKESDLEVDFIFQLAKKWDLPLYVESLPVKKISQKLKKNLEEIARLLRYRALLRLTQKIQNSVVLTGHNADDYIETLFLRFIRGTYLSNIYFWNQRRIILKIANKNYSLLVLSPLLLFEKKEIIDYLHRNQIEYLVDPSNFDIQFKRNFIRHKVLPPLKQIGFRPSLLWQRTHLKEMYFTKEKEKEKEYIYLDRALFSHLSNREIKIFLDQITKNLGIYPLQKEIIKELIQQSYGQRIFIESKEIIIASARKQIWLIRKNSYLLKEPKILEKDEFTIIEWNHQKRIYKKGIYINFLEKESNRSLKNRITEIFREKSFPPVIRNHLPYIVDQNTIKILLSFLEEFWDYHITL